jgi:type IX secretion system PorP/SprF family membrane protein
MTQLRVNHSKTTVQNTRLLVAFIFLFVLNVKGQDPHFSQYFSSPLTLNPANTGNFEGPYRVASNFRNQWQGIGNPYVTGTFSFDAEFMKDRIQDGDKFAVGVLGLYDRALGGKFNASFAGVSLGYHLWLDEDRMNKLSVGFQSVLVNKRLDLYNITFASQFTSQGFDLNIPSNEIILNNNINYVDWNTGLLYNHLGENGSYYAGVSAYHITRPKEGFIGEKSSSVPMRFTVNAGMNRYLGEMGVLMGSAMFQSQGNANELTVGFAYGQYLSSAGNDISVFMGGWYRNKESIIPYFGFNYNNLQIGLSYDVVTSGLNLSKTSNRSIEISAIFSFRDLSQQRKFIPWY